MSGAQVLDGAQVAIVGWAGATARQLRVVEGWYRTHGGRPFVVTPTVFRNMALPSGWTREGERLATALRRTRGPIVVHAFSNAGFWTYAAALRAMDAATRERVIATVLDSAPGFPAVLEPSFTAHHSAMAMMPMLLRALRRRPALHHRLLDPPLRAFMRLWYHVSPRQIREAEESLRVVAETGSSPILVFYSTRDTLVPAVHVEAFMASMPSRDVRHRRWDDSEHVQHMIRHRHAYFEAISELVVRAQRRA